MRFGILLLWTLGLLPALRGQEQAASSESHHMEITLQRLEGGQWKLVDPTLIFARGEQLRFRYRTNFDGYLYVMNRSTSGKYQQLFPSDEAGHNNHVKGGQEYTVPATQAAFRVAGPAGYEVIYWVVSPVEMKEGGEAPHVPVPPPPPAGQGPSKELMPRCNDEVFRARGECVDISAGMKGVPDGEKVPEKLSATGAITSRDLLFLRKEKTTVVASPLPLTGPIIYEFRLAHK
ncbi:MAG: DUF4384 domain-containing protein [Bryobacteraceae bacterium]